MDQEKAIERLYGFRIEELKDRSTVDSNGHLGMTDFRKKKILIPGFGDVLKRYPKLGPIADWVKSYILGHEIEVEAYGRPRGEKDHSKREMQYLEGLRERGEIAQHATGLAIHRLRIKYGDRTGFSTYIKDYVEKGKEMFAEYVKPLEDQIAMLLGIKKPKMEYAFTKA